MKDNTTNRKEKIIMENSYKNDSNELIFLLFFNSE